jgi:transcription antitermination factor NusG
MPLIGPERCLFPETLLSPEFQVQGKEAGRQWRVLYTRSRMEKELMRRLTARAAPFYSPIIENRYRSPAGRQRTSYLPLFSNYVFLFGAENERYDAMATGCVSRSLDVTAEPEFVSDLRRIRALIDTGVPVSVESMIEAGDRVRIKSGSMTGLEGTVFKRHGQSRLLVMVDFLQQGASIELPDWEVELL